MDQYRLTSESVAVDSQAFVRDSATVGGHNQVSVWILGASDPEMQHVEALLQDQGVVIGYAATADGQRVFPGAAYRAVQAIGRDGTPLSLDGAALAVVECDLPGITDAVPRYDHHRAGDPGYGQPPAAYWEASSLGQVATAFGVEPTPSLRMVAAADHCLAAAYRGECPGVDPDALMQWRVETRAAFQGRPVDVLLADVERARALLATAPRLIFGGVAVADMRALERAAHIPELPEAATREGVPFLSAARDRGTNREKIVLMAAPPDAARAFIACAKEFGAGEVYGDPARGFVGVYSTPTPVATPSVRARL